jgi:hypothetical protein
MVWRVGMPWQSGATGYIGRSGQTGERRSANADLPPRWAALPAARPEAPARWGFFVKKINKLTLTCKIHKK